MARDLTLLGGKLRTYREQFRLSLEDLAAATGIDPDKLRSCEDAQSTPSGDEILILSDFYKCDYRFLISNERLAPIEQTTKLYRRFGSDFSVGDRWAVQEVLFLADCEAHLEEILGRSRTPFRFDKHGSYFKGHAEEAARSLRTALGYGDREVPRDIYADFRQIGIHVFRRKLENSKISGLYIYHPLAGKTILVNYDEDVYRQRFTAAHEAAHAIFEDEDVVVSFVGSGYDLIEVRANAFASRFLMPPEFLRAIPVKDGWDEHLSVEWAGKLTVSVEALVYALREAGIMDEATAAHLKMSSVPLRGKVDPELPREGV